MNRTNYTDRILRALKGADSSKWKEPQDKYRKRKARSMPTEREEQKAVCSWLTANGYRFFHVPYGAVPGTSGMCPRCRNLLRQAWYRLTASLRVAGFVKGVPDLILHCGPPRARESRVAVEMKRSSGGRLSDAQKSKIAELEEDGWTVIVGHGAKDAIEKLKRMGY